MVTKHAWGLLGIAATLIVGTAIGHADNTKSTGKVATSKATTGKVRPAAHRLEEGAPQPAKETKAAPIVTMELGTAKPCPTESSFSSTPSPCAPSKRHSHGAWCRFWDWLTYRPVTDLRGSCCKEMSCTPPLYAYYLEYCPPPATPPKAACADSRCATKPVREEVVEKERFSLLPSFLFGKSSEKRTSKPAAEKAPEPQQVKHTEIVPASRKVVVVEAPQPEEQLLRNGTESSKWRGVPTRPLEAGRR